MYRSVRSKLSAGIARRSEAREVSLESVTRVEGRVVCLRHELKSREKQRQNEKESFKVRQAKW